MMDKFLSLRGVPALLLTLFFSVILCVPAVQNGGSPAPGRSAADSPKCSFIRRQIRDIAANAEQTARDAPLAWVKSPQDVASSHADLKALADFIVASEVLKAHQTILELELSACEQGVALSDPSRLGAIDQARADHLKRVATRWQEVTGLPDELDAGMLSQVESPYLDEAKSFYNSQRKMFEDPDAGKDYPGLLELIQGSLLDQGTKDFYRDASRYLRYDEAGTLANALHGTDGEHSIAYAYQLRGQLANRLDAAGAESARLAAQQAADAARVAVEHDSESAKRALEETNERNRRMTMYSVLSGLGIVMGLSLWLFADRYFARYRAFRTGANRSSFWFGHAEWILWEPGETVVLLDHKRLVPMVQPTGGYCTISAWRGQEYKGRISYKTLLLAWKSGPIHTSDGLTIELDISIWWKISDAVKYISSIASHYHEGKIHHSERLEEAAVFWIEKLAAGTLREEINQLPAEKLISPYVQAYLQVRRGPQGEMIPEGNPIKNFADQLHTAQQKLDAKTQEYGIQIMGLEAQELRLPPRYQEKLEAVRIAFLQPSETAALTDAQVIALRGLASVIGEEKVGLIQVLKSIDLSGVGGNPFSAAIPVVQPILGTLQLQTDKALSPQPDPGLSLPSAPPNTSSPGRGSAASGGGGN